MTNYLSNNLLDDFDFIQAPTNGIDGEEFAIEKTEKEIPECQIEVFLKPAKSRDDQYEPSPFPYSLLCSPYKYDMKIVGNMDKETEESLTVELVDSTTLQPVHVPLSAVHSAKISNHGGLALTVEPITKVDKQERVIRFALNLTSFHVNRKSFCLLVKSATNNSLFVSSEFRTYARRREYHNYNRPNTAQSPQSPERKKSPVNDMLSKVPPISMYLPYGHLPPMMEANERTSLAIQLMNSLTPVERQTVNYYVQGCVPMVPLHMTGSYHMMPSAVPMHPLLSRVVPSPATAAYRGNMPMMMMPNTVMVGGLNAESYYKPGMF
ncbi:developmentally-regulated protein [Acrasis kona]|uniref:Developmentally-regulated protein n=1 Tax=Acrasis kona TaxID=1008807 RepID=A0AAW2ZII7_9EUKA